MLSVIGVHGDDQAADRPEHAIFDAADHPDPALGHLVGRGGRDQQMDEGDEADILRCKCRRTSRCASTVSIAPAIYIQVAGGLKPASTKNSSVAGTVILPMICGMKNSAADDAQDVEFVEQVEFVGERHRFPRRPDPRAEFIAFLRAERQPLPVPGQRSALHRRIVAREHRLLAGTPSGPWSRTG